MQLTQLRNYLAVMEAGTFRGAARTLKVSQPALTRSIRQLETELEAKLLERTGRGVVATPAGRAFLSRSRMIVRELGKAKEELAAISGTGDGSVAFGVSLQAAIHIVPPAVADFRRTHPNAELRIMDGVSDAMLPMLRDGTLDFVIGTRPRDGTDSLIKAHPLFTNQLVIGGRRGHPLAKAKSIADLIHASWVILNPYGGVPGGFVRELFRKHGLAPPKSVVWSDSYIAMLTLLASTDLIGILGGMLLKHPLAREFYEELDVKERLPEVTLSLLLRTDSMLTPAAAAMVSAVRDAAKRLVIFKRGARVS